MELFNFIERDTFLVFGVLVLTALAALLSERSGIINIALEGQLMSATLGYTLVSFFLKKQVLDEHLHYLLAILGAISFSLVTTLFFAFFVINMKMNQILTALAINIIIFGLGSFIIVSLKKTPQLSINSDYLNLYISKQINSYWKINDGKKLILPIIYQFFAVLVIVLLLYVFLFKTRPGLHLRSCGEKPQISKINGISVTKFRYLALIMGGVLIGFGGTLFAEWKSSFSGGVDGFGYLSLAILILGMRNIWLICVFSFIFVVSQTLVFSLTGNEFKELINTLNFVLPLLALTIYGIIWKQKSGKNAPPQSLGL